MALTENPKLAMIPSGYGDYKVYSVLPSDGTGDFDFVRSSGATRVNKSGLIETVGFDVPRLNYPMIDGVVSGCPSLLLEPQRTQRVQYSEDFSNAYWIKSGVSVVDGFLSPKGDLSAYKLTESNTNAKHQLVKLNAFPSNTEYTYSFFAKKGERNFVSYIFSGVTNTSSVYFDLENGVIGSTNAVFNMTLINQSIEPYGNDWFRCSLTFTQAVNTSVSIVVSDQDYGASEPAYQGDGTSGVYIWGAQLEQGSYATSYIPNYGTALGVTRSAETCNGAGDADTFNDSEGVLMAEISALANDSTYKIISVSNPTSSNRVSVFYGNASDVIRIQVLKDGVAQIDQSTSSYDITQYNKIALKYKQNDFVLWINGIKVLTYNLGDTPIGLIKLNFDEGEGSNDFYGNTKQIQYFDTALIDSELETLTSWTSFNEMAISQQYSLY